jgi:hypothetical protein
VTLGGLATVSTSIEIDSRAKRILFHSYWSAKGWKNPREEPSPEDLAYAISVGVMFGRGQLTHKVASRRIVAARAQVSLAAAAESFMASLRSRQVHLRAALASLCAVQKVELHPFDGHPVCSTCGQLKQWEHDFSATNFACLKWGSVPRYFMVDHAFVLERFIVEPQPRATDEDRQLLFQLLAVADGLPADARARDLEEAWKPRLGSNREERDALIEILSGCGVLSPSRGTQSDLQRIPLKSNWSDEVALWRGGDRVNRGRAAMLFGWT